MDEQADVIVAAANGWGRLTLNRPRALNALTTDMCEAINAALLAWKDDPEVGAVLIDHAGERGFCAGGDIRKIAEGAAGDGEGAKRFFTAEYRMNELLFRYPKPVVAVMDGITMGGGVGLSMPARIRIASERTVWAMPEGDIGLFPDVGSGWYLPRLPGEAGTWLALTGARLRAADMLALGIATHVVDAERISDLKARLLAGSFDKTALADFTSEPGPAQLAEHRASIDRQFAYDTVEEIVAALRADTSAWAGEQAAALSKKCPTTLKTALRLVRQGLDQSGFASEMALEYRLAARMCSRHDFIEGVRAVIVDKDNAPQWRPSGLEEVSEEAIDALFAPATPGEEWTPLPA